MLQAQLPTSPVLSSVDSKAPESKASSTSPSWTTTDALLKAVSSAANNNPATMQYYAMQFLRRLQDVHVLSHGLYQALRQLASAEPVAAETIAALSAVLHWI